MMKKRIVTVFVDATTGPTVSVGQKVKRGEIVGRTPENEIVVAPISGTLMACHFDNDEHLLCLFIEEGTSSS